MMYKHKQYADETRNIKTRSTLKIGGKTSSRRPKHEVFVAKFVCFNPLPDWPSCLPLIRRPQVRLDLAKRTTFEENAVLMTSARSVQSQGRRLRAIVIAAAPLSLPQDFQIFFFSFRLLVKYNKIQYLDNRETTQIRRKYLFGNPVFD